MKLPERSPTTGSASAIGTSGTAQFRKPVHSVAPPAAPERSRETTGEHNKPLPRRYLVFAVVSLGLLMASIDQTIVATALPAIQDDLHATINWSGWTITIYSLGQIVTMPLAGRLSDQYGRKKIFLSAVVLFTVTSLCCGFATSIYVLLPLRALQAIGGGAFMPSASGIVADQFGRDRDKALGMFASIFPIGGIAGPIMGGVFVTYWSWRGIFLVNVPTGLLLLVLGWKIIPHSVRRPSGRTDKVGVILLAVLLIATMLGITYLGNGSRTMLNPVFLGCEAVAIAGGWLFIRHVRHAQESFIPGQLLYGKGFGVMNVINFLYGGAALGFGALVPLYAEERYHIRSLEAGTLLTARAVGMICVAGLAVMALRRTGYRLPMVGGFLAVAVGLAIMAMHPHGTSAYMWLAATAALTGIGMGLAVPASNNASMRLAPDQIAAISGLRGMFRQSGSIIAISVTTALLARSAHPGLTQADVLLAFAVILVCTIPMIWLVPDRRGSW